MVESNTSGSPVTVDPAASEIDAELLPAGTVVGEFVLEELLGAGGFARVYRASHPVLGTSVAVKVITRALSMNAEAARRFEREAQAASRIDHPNVVRVLGFGKLADGRAYQVMELVEGPALDDYLAAGRRIPVELALRMLDAISLALDAAHRAGIVHRDVKPANVLLAAVDGEPSPRLTDFGIAKALELEETPHLTRTGTTLGTPSYMSPEQALGRPVGAASDVYSFGVVAFEMITGRAPFEGASALEIMMQHVQADPPAASTIAPELGARFDAPLAWLLAKHPETRPPTLAVAMAALRAAEVPRRGRGTGWRVAAAIAAVAGVAIAALWVVRASRASSALPLGTPLPAAVSLPIAVDTRPPVPSAPAAPPPSATPVEPAPAVRSPATGTPARTPTSRPVRDATPPPRVAPPVDREPAAAADTLETPPDYTP